MNRRYFLSSSVLFGASSLMPATRGVLANEPPGNWSTAASMPINTQELYATVHDSKLFVAGGIAAKLGVVYFTDRFFNYDPAKDLWADLAALPEDMHHAALVSTGERLFLVGGFNGGYTHIWRMRDRVYEFTDGVWEQRPSLPRPQAEGVLAAHQGDVHLVSGQSPRGKANSRRSDHSEVSEHLIWQAGAGRWEQAAPIPLARNSATGGWLENQLIVTGGRNADGNFQQTHIYDKQEDKWRDAAPLPLPQAGTASAVVDDGIVVFGGEIFVPQSKVYSQVWRYSLSRDNWTTMPDLPTPRHGLGAGKIGNRIYVVGGATEPSGRGTTNVNEVLSL